MIGRNRAASGPWAEAVAATAPQIVGGPSYNRLSVVQPLTHTLLPWPSMIFAVFSISIWYNVINQFMIQRVLGAKDMYHARMGIVMAGYLKVLMPFLVVVPGLILYAQHPEILSLPWKEVQPEADKGYVRLLQILVPAGLRGLFLAALFGAIQSTVNSVLNSTATIFTVDLYQRLGRRNAPEQELIRVGVWSSVGFLVVSILLALLIKYIQGSLFVYIQTLYAFFAPPFAAVFLLGILFRRINGPGATAGVLTGFAAGLLMKLVVQFVPGHPRWLEPFMTQAIANWAICVVVCVAVSLLTPPPKSEQVDDNLTINWRRLNLFAGLGTHWYNSVVLWWLLFCGMIAGLMLWFSGLVFGR
jgi:SSS family solute:Na+ symporter